jgi:hypothetical protein
VWGTWTGTGARGGGSNNTFELFCNGGACDNVDRPARKKLGTISVTINIRKR